MPLNLPLHGNTSDSGSNSPTTWQLLLHVVNWVNRTEINSTKRCVSTNKESLPDYVQLYRCSICQSTVTQQTSILLSNSCHMHCKTSWSMLVVTASMILCCTFICNESLSIGASDLTAKKSQSGQATMESRKEQVSSHRQLICNV